MKKYIVVKTIYTLSGEIVYPTGAILTRKDLYSGFNYFLKEKYIEPVHKSVSEIKQITDLLPQQYEYVPIITGNRPKLFDTTGLSNEQRTKMSQLYDQHKACADIIIPTRKNASNLPYNYERYKNTYWLHD